MAQPASAAIRCSIVETEAPAVFWTTVHRREGVTADQIAGISASRSVMSVRRNQMPQSAGPGRTVMRTAAPE